MAPAGPHDGDEPIHAPSTAPGHAERAIVRVSGAGCLGIVDAWLGAPGTLTGSTGGRVHRAALPLGGFDLPVYLHVSRAPRSYTGEDLLEIHLDGHPALVEGVARELEERGVRAARPGEFTRRAFLNGRLDLGQCEAVLELVRTNDLERGRAATGLLIEGRGREVPELREELVRTLAFLEAHLDFEEVEVAGAEEGLRADLATLLERVARVRARWEALPALRDRPRVALVGPPSVGKSSLFNALVGEELALVDEQPGTTRDVLAAACRFGEFEVELLDQPGRAVADPARRAFEEAQIYGVDVLLVCRDAADAAPWEPPDHPLALAVELRADRTGLAAVAERTTGVFFGRARLSARQGRGLAELGALVAAALERAASAGASGEADLRHRAALRAVEDAVSRGLEGLCLGEPFELVAEELRLALAALDEVTGHSTPEDLLDRIFGQFCLGK